MIDLVRKHIVILAGAVLGWSGYSFYDAGQAKPEAQAKAQMTEIGPKFMALRDPSVAFAVSNDPYRFEGAAERVVRSVPAHAATHAAAAAGADAAASGGGRLLRRSDPAAAGRRRSRRAISWSRCRSAAPRERGPRARVGARGRRDGRARRARRARRAAARRLRARAAVDARQCAPAGQARINGRTVEEGDELPFLDALDPPVLERVQGSTIVVSHDGQEYLVDLLENPVLQVGLPATTEAAVAAPASAPAKTSAPSASPKPASATGGPAVPGGRQEGDLPRAREVEQEAMTAGLATALPLVVRLLQDRGVISAEQLELVARARPSTPTSSRRRSCAASSPAEAGRWPRPTPTTCACRGSSAPATSTAASWSSTCPASPSRRTSARSRTS
jgi:hypothetical protein